MTQQYEHGMKVAALAYQVALQMELPQNFCNKLILAGVMHDIGKIPLQQEMNPDNAMLVEELGYLRQHPQRGYEMMRQHRIEDEVCEMVLYHHENWDGTGYPFNLEGHNIPVGSCILRVCDVFCALTDVRPYRDAYPIEKALDLMIHEIKNYNVRVFLALQQILHDEKDGSLRIPECPIDLRGELRKYGIEEKAGNRYEGYPSTGDGNP